MKLDQVRAGMLLVKDVFDPQGCILVRSGVTVTDRHIRAFKSWGVTEVTVQSGNAAAPSQAQDPTALVQMREFLDTQFSLSNLDHPAVRALYELCLERALSNR